MLTELLSGGAFQFRDTRVANVLVTLHMIVCSIPASGRLDGEETRVQALIVDVLLTFTQGVSEQVHDCLCVYCEAKYVSVSRDGETMFLSAAGHSHRRDFSQ